MPIKKNKIKKILFLNKDNISLQKIKPSSVNFTKKVKRHKDIMIIMLSIVMVSLAQNLRSSNIASDQMLYYLLSVSITIYNYVAEVNVTFTSFASE